jgi:hypothetical protein
MANAEKNETSGWAERVERLVRLIPGLGKYQDREGLREADKRVRTYVAEFLGKLRRELEPAQRRMEEERRLERVTVMDGLGRLLATLADRVRFASYGFAGVFAAHKIREAELAALHGFDMRLMEEIPRLRTSLRSLAEAAGRDHGFAEAARAAEDGLRRLEETLDERDRFARGL